MLEKVAPLEHELDGLSNSLVSSKHRVTQCEQDLTMLDQKVRQHPALLCSATCILVGSMITFVVELAM